MPFVSARIWSNTGGGKIDMDKSQRLNDPSEDEVEKRFAIIPADPQPGLKLAVSFARPLDETRAFELSIEKWELIYKQCVQGVIIDDGGRGTCALCELYYFGHNDECEECPIRLAGHPGCEGTPYWDYQDALNFNNLPQARQAAADEIKFLQDLVEG